MNAADGDLANARRYWLVMVLSRPPGRVGPYMVVPALLGCNVTEDRSEVMIER